MVGIEGTCYLAAVLCLIGSRKFVLFTSIRAGIFLCWPLWAVIDAHSHWQAYQFWHTANKADILLSLLCARLIWEEMPAVGWLLLLRPLVDCMMYGLVNRDQEIHPYQTLFLLSKWMDIAANVAVIWYCNLRSLHAERAPDSPRTSSHPA